MSTLSISYKKAPLVLKQLFLYGLIGLLTNFAAFLVFLLLTYWNIGPKTAMSCLYVCSALLAYFGNWRLTFKGNGSFRRTSVCFLGVYCLGYGINLFLLFFFCDHLGHSYYWIQAMAIFIVAIYIFLASKLFVFSTNRNL